MNRYKRITFIIVVIVLFIILTTSPKHTVGSRCSGHFFSHAEARGAEWIKYTPEIEGIILFYDADSIIRSNKNIVNVWTKEEYVGERLKKERQERPNISYLLIYEEILCGERKQRPLSFVVKSEDGKVLETHDIPKGGEEEYWGFITPGSLGDRLYEILCNGRLRR